MHLHALTFQAIGPFAGRHHVDLAALGSSGIFLLEGPTGAGKSTLIDAVVFALYGKVASAAASDDRIRSAYASPEVESFVDLVLETGSGVYRVRRTPEYRRPKKRGTGTTTQQAGVRLWRLAGVPRTDVPLDDLDPDGDLLSSRLDEAGLEIQRLVGLDRRQLVQTVVLPQGEFASFLRADPEERRGLLQKVFGTEVYEQVQARLAELQRAAQRDVAAARQAVSDAASTFVGAAGLGADDARELRAAADDHARLVGGGALVGTGAGAVGADDVATGADAVGTDAVAGADPSVATASLPDLVAAHVAAAHAAAAGLADEEATARERLAQARTAQDAARTLAEDVGRRAALLAEQEALAAAGTRADADRERRDAARRAAVVLPGLEGARRAAAERSAAREQVALARPALPAALRDADPTALLAVQAGVQDARARLARLAAVGHELPGLTLRAADARKEAARLAEEHARLEAGLAARPAERAALVAQAAEHVAAAEDLGARQERAAAATTVLAAARDAARTAADLAAARGAAEAAVVAADEALTTETRLRRARIAGIAGEIAGDLVAGEPCAVCGSVDHPAPAATGADHVGAATVEDAERVRAAAERSLADARAAVAGLEERLAAHRAASAGLDEQAATDALAAARDAVDASARAVAARDAAVAARDALDARTAQEAAALTDTAAQAAHARAETARLDADVARGRAEIDAERATTLALLGGDVVLPDPWAPGAAADPVAVLERALADHAHHLDGVIAAEDRAAAATRAADQREQEAAAQARDAGFADADAARAAALDPAALATLDAAVARHEQAAARVAAGLAEHAALDPALTAAGTAAALAEAAARTTAAEEDATAVGRRHEHAARTADAAARAAEGVEHAVAAWSAARAAAAPVTRMATLAAGSGSDNARALSLATYVLVRRFEDVVAAANARLAEMSDGRYALERSDEKEDVRSRRTGLAMKVLDHRTQQTRDPRTLSGGETFYVSLCLALGLADVVTAEAGGVELGTLFVDEGFGTLDPETLDSVLAALGRLRAGGRVVGVVSHVEALKQSVAERVEVRRRPDGSSTLTVRA